jgi:hypothetical protein
MTPEEKAMELVLRYLRIDNNTIQWFNLYIAKQCALIAVDEIIDILEINGFTLQEYHDKGTLEYWIHVKDEIENL